MSASRREILTSVYSGSSPPSGSSPSVDQDQDPIGSVWKDYPLDHHHQVLGHDHHHAHHESCPRRVHHLLPLQRLRLLELEDSPPSASIRHGQFEDAVRLVEPFASRYAFRSRRNSLEA